MAAAGVLAEANADAWLKEVLAAALEANERLARLTEELQAGNAQREAQLERMAAAADPDWSGRPAAYRHLRPQLMASCGSLAEYGFLGCLSERGLGGGRQTRSVPVEDHVQCDHRP